MLRNGADLALAASGTVSLELAAAATPMVIAYDFQWLTWQIMRRMALVDTVTLVNLVSESRTVPECLGPDCRPGLIAARLEEVCAAPQAQRKAMALTMERLGQGGEAPGLRAARAVLSGLERAGAQPRHRVQIDGTMRCNKTEEDHNPAILDEYSCVLPA